MSGGEPTSGGLDLVPGADDDGARPLRDFDLGDSVGREKGEVLGPQGPYGEERSSRAAVLSAPEDIRLDLAGRDPHAIAFDLGQLHAVHGAGALGDHGAGHDADALAGRNGGRGRRAGGREADQGEGVAGLGQAPAGDRVGEAVHRRLVEGRLVQKGYRVAEGYSAQGRREGDPLRWKAQIDRIDEAKGVVGMQQHRLNLAS